VSRLATSLPLLHQSWLYGALPPSQHWLAAHTMSWHCLEVSRAVHRVPTTVLLHMFSRQLRGIHAWHFFLDAAGVLLCMHAAAGSSASRCL